KNYNITKVILHDLFDINLLKNITHIKFTSLFNQPIDNLPDSLISLIFGNSFNQPIDNLPNSLQYLTFGCNFRYSFKILPKNLTHLTLGCCNDSYELLDYLPNSLIYLHLNNR